MRRYACLLSLCLLLPIVAFAQETAELGEKLKKLLAEKYPADGPGVAVLVKQNGKVLLRQGFGMFDLEKKSPITPTTNFDLASLSKPITAMALLKLVDDGKVKLDDRVKDLLPGFPEVENADQILVRHLLNHTSGLNDYIGYWKGKPEEFHTTCQEDVLKLIAGKKLNFKPGTKFQYSNTNYGLIPLLVKKITGQGFNDYCQQEIFKPLGMTGTCIVDDMKVKPLERALGYRKRKGEWERAAMDGPICGDGNVFSNLNDLEKFAEGVAARKILKPETWEAVFKAPDFGKKQAMKYGFGWMLFEEDGQPGYSHAGGWAGTRTTLRWQDKGPMLVIVLSNSESTSPDRVADDLLKEVRTKPSPQR